MYSQNETAYTGLGVCILENAYNVKINRKLNGDCTLEFDLPLNDPKAADVITENQVKVDNTVFIVKQVVQQRDEDGRKVTHVNCDHVMQELMDKYIGYYEELGTTATAALTVALAGTRFKPNTSLITGTRDVTVDDANPLKVINEIIAQWSDSVSANIEILCSGLPDPVDGKFTVGLYTRIGTDNGVQFRYRKNIKSIKKTTDSRDVITRLYVYGKDALDITAATQNPAHLAYIDSAYIGNYRAIKEGSKTFNDEGEPDSLYDVGAKYLSSVELPKVTYEVNVIELKFISGYTAETFDLGDTITVVDEELGANVAARIVEYEYYPYEKTRSKIVLANFKDVMLDYFRKLEEARQTVDDITSGGKVLTSAFEAFAAAAVADINNSKSEIMYDSRGIVLQDKTVPQKQVVASSAGVMVTTDGGVTTKAAITANGVVAENVVGVLGLFAQVKTDNLIAGTAKIGSALIDKITASQIDVTGGRIVAAQIDATNLHVSSANIDGTITAGSVVAGISISSPVISGGQITIGSGNNVVKADSNGLYAGNASFASAPFKVDMAGAVTATNITLTGSGVTLSGLANINVSSNVTIGNKLYLSPSNFGNGVSWSNNDNTGKKAEIYIDNASNAMFLQTYSGGIYANGRRIDTAPTAVFG